MYCTRLTPTSRDPGPTRIHQTLPYTPPDPAQLHPALPDPARFRPIPPHPARL